MSKLTPLLSKISKKNEFLQVYAQDLIDLVPTNLDKPEMELDAKGLPTVIITGQHILNDGNRLCVRNFVKFLAEHKVKIVTTYTIYGKDEEVISHESVEDRVLEETDLTSYTEALEEQYSKVRVALKLDELPASFLKDFTSLQAINNSAKEVPNFVKSEANHRLWNIVRDCGYDSIEQLAKRYPTLQDLLDDGFAIVKNLTIRNYMQAILDSCNGKETEISEAPSEEEPKAKTLDLSFFISKEDYRGYNKEIDSCTEDLYDVVEPDSIEITEHEVENEDKDTLITISFKAKPDTVQEDLDNSIEIFCQHIESLGAFDISYDTNLHVEVSEEDKRAELKAKIIERFLANTNQSGESFKDVVLDFGNFEDDEEFQSVYLEDIEQALCEILVEEGIMEAGEDYSDLELGNDLLDDILIEARNYFD